MEQSSEYIGVLVIFVMAAGIAAAMLFLNHVLGPKARNAPAVKGEPFECGVEPLSRSSGHFSVKFYLIAMLFILFDVEIVWLFPWATLLRELGWAGIVQMFSFLGVLVLGFVYAWKKGALEWEK